MDEKKQTILLADNLDFYPEELSQHLGTWMPENRVPPKTPWFQTSSSVFHKDDNNISLFPLSKWSYFRCLGIRIPDAPLPAVAPAPPMQRGCDSRGVARDLQRG